MHKVALNDSTVIRSNLELTRGDWVDAYYDGVLVRRGEVIATAPNPELFWIHDVFTGGARLLDTAGFKVRKRVRDIKFPDQLNKSYELLHLPGQ